MRDVVISVFSPTLHQIQLSISVMCCKKTTKKTYSSCNNIIDIEEFLLVQKLEFPKSAEFLKFLKHVSFVFHQFTISGHYGDRQLQNDQTNIELQILEYHGSLHGNDFMYWLETTERIGFFTTKKFWMIVWSSW